MHTKRMEREDEVMKVLVLNGSPKKKSDTLWVTFPFEGCSATPTNFTGADQNVNGD